MLDGFLFIGLAYTSVFVCVVGMAHRLWKDPFSQSAHTSQFLESKSLFWGTVPFHAGILTVLIGHAIAILLPGVWQAAMGHRAALLAIEAIGAAASILCVFGLVVLLCRRLVTPRLQTVTTTMDLAVLTLLLVQVIAGLAIAFAYRWGAAWAPQTLVPYLWSLVRLRPNLAYVVDMAPVIKIHIALAWVLILLIPFSRLSHFLALPVAYIFRPPQKVVWANMRYKPDQDGVQADRMANRRLFLRGVGGTGLAVGLLTLGTADKLVRFFQGPDMTPEENENLLKKKLARLQMAANQRKLELERMNAPYVMVAKYSELSSEKGKYFIDYDMNPGMAFVEKDGTPLVMSAKCTHLGCTVGNKVDAKGRVLCPCHISYFDIRTGEPNKGAPAKAALPRLGWVLKNSRGEIVVSRGGSGDVEGATDPDMLQDCVLYIARPMSENA